ncbi:MAG TPA: rRNA adenine N-6-methyltransferase family protein [Candidatus Thermoplasmatota archaeon]|nr:rRNA adenine N-6-methyltransferase family protein [Candidatus Thermoplasmatota archaeon]
MPAVALGQHLLVHEPSIRRVVDAAGLARGETVLDVGAGEGALAKEALRRVGSTGKVLAVEIHAGYVRQLRSEAREGLFVTHGDALVVPLARADAVVANPPFRLAAPILKRLLDAGFGRAVLVLPRELVERLTAAVGSERYGRLTVETALRAGTERLFGLPRWAFEPQPGVFVDVARIVPREGAPAAAAAALAKVLDAGWENRRRTMRHALGGLGPTLRVSSGKVTEALRALDVESARPQDVAPETWLEIARRLSMA